MAVLALIVDTEEYAIDLGLTGQDDQVTERFTIKLDAASLDGPAILDAAHAFNPVRFPTRGQAWPIRPTYGLFAKRFAMRKANELGSLWTVTVTYAPLDPSEPNTSEHPDDPLRWPPTFNLEEIEYEEAVEEAKNLDAFAGRPAGTLGAAVNSALQQFENGIFEPVVDPVIVRTDYVATLTEIIKVNRDYARTCNSDTIYDVGARRFKFLSCRTTGQMKLQSTTVFERQIRIQLKKTTDGVFGNSGWKYKDDAGALKSVSGAEPRFLVVATGALSPTPTTVRYRWLDEVPYLPILQGAV